MSRPARQKPEPNPVATLLVIIIAVGMVVGLVLLWNASNSMVG